MILSGSICALATPLRSRDDGLDLEACGRLVDYQLEGGTRALVVAGSTGEAAALDDAEYSALIEFVSARVAGRVPVLAGTGLPATAKTIAQTQRARAAGADAALVVAPAYVRPTQAGMLRHFNEVAERGGLPVVLYNVPARTSSDLLPETVAQLARHGNIVGIKEALPDAQRMQALLALRTDRFRIFSGDDSTGARAMRAGADGVISVAANVAPRLFSAMCQSCAAGAADAEALDRALQPLYAALGAEPNPIPLKWCLAQLGLGEAHLRLPLLPLSPAYHAATLDTLNRLGLVEAVRAAG
ncbi:4-hydroxy-tetrahydrodipicolinate synthase [Dokdonella sp.]|uniref:4-hydroxy-tetrahydrodipicolinate synthase n=1 Tax=Dokdonella sp. TaxID=2291710 RepID=UPI001B0B68CC|nr:4-hydroxy-tetrahydrodipicolinate synthase [Dokdonella sp.]MBO9662376.1 4-hydroxy-tetrahydrodipicolinate synthase [Dokdonella sp.]